MTDDTRQLPPESPDEWTADERATIASAWEVVEPPPSFADRVVNPQLARRQATAHAGRPSSANNIVNTSRAHAKRVMVASVAMVALAAAAALWLWPKRNGDGVYSSPAIAATDRQSVEMAGRAVAVLEPTARLSWTNDGKTIRVKQTAGSVFYRVNSGNPFVVNTPEGDVVVHGTCFRIEVLPMNNTAKLAISAGIGAAVTSAILVTVYEGKVKVDHAGGSATVAAGEQMRVGGNVAKMVGGPKPAVVIARPMSPELIAALAPPRTGATAEELLQRDQLLRDYATSLDQKIAALEKELSEAPSGEKADGNARPWEYTPADWRDLAKDCGLFFDTPPLELPIWQLRDKLIGQLGLSPDEAKAINAVYKRNLEPLIGDIRAMYLEVTGDEHGADTLDVMSMQRELEQKAGDKEASDARRRVALEKAGDEPTPADDKARPSIERYYRLIANVADRIEGDVAEIIGPERARELRQNASASVSKIKGCSDDGT